MSKHFLAAAVSAAAILAAPLAASAQSAYENMPTTMAQPNVPTTGPGMSGVVSPAMTDGSGGSTGPGTLPNGQTAPQAYGYNAPSSSYGGSTYPGPRPSGH